MHYGFYLVIELLYAPQVLVELLVECLQLQNGGRVALLEVRL